MRRRAATRRALAGLGLLALVAVALRPELAPTMGTAAPALILFGLLLCGDYVGEERLARAVLWVDRRLRLRGRRPARTAVAVRARRTWAPVVRGGRLIAAALAVRPPPLAHR